MSKDSISKNSWLRRVSKYLGRDSQLHNHEQLLVLLREAKQHNLVDPDVLGMMESILQITHMNARDIMVPRAQMIMVQEDAKPEEFLPIIIESGHSRFPVIGDIRGEVIGILLAKDLLKYSFQKQTEEFSIKDSLRPAVFVPESKRLDILLKEFRITRNHMAIVVDEYGSVAGLVTIEDVLEQIVGEIEDEFDVDTVSNIKQLNPTQFIIKAITPIEEFNQYFHAKFSDAEFDTIGGIVLHAFGHLPKRGEKIALKNFAFEVLHADNRRIRLLKCILTTNA